MHAMRCDVSPAPLAGLRPGKRRTAAGSSLAGLFSRLGAGQMGYVVPSRPRTLRRCEFMRFVLAKWRASNASCSLCENTGRFMLSPTAGVGCPASAESDKSLECCRTNVWRSTYRAQRLTPARAVTSYELRSTAYAGDSATSHHPRNHTAPPPPPPSCAARRATPPARSLRRRRRGRAIGRMPPRASRT